MKTNEFTLTFRVAHNEDDLEKALIQVKHRFVMLFTVVSRLDIRSP